MIVKEYCGINLLINQLKKYFKKRTSYLFDFITEIVCSFFELKDLIRCRAPPPISLIKKIKLIGGITYGKNA